MKYIKYSVAILGFLLTFNVAFAAGFPDVPEDHENYTAITYLKDHGVVGGYQDGTFLPNAPVNRAEALKIILLSSGIDTDFNGEIDPSDVPKDAWFYKYIGKALELEIVSGYKDKTFRPAAEINLVETLKMVILAYDLPFTATDGEEWYKPYLNYALEKNIILLDAVGESHPDATMTRASFAEILYRFAFMKEHKLTAFPLSQDWEYYERVSDYYRLKVPLEWVIREESTRTVVWRKTENQLDYYRMTPDSATLVLHKKDNLNGVGAKDFFKMVRELNSQVFALDEVFFEEFSIFEMPVLSVFVPRKNLRDYYFYLPNGKFLIAYAEAAEGNLKAQNLRYMDAAVKNLQFLDVGQVDEATKKAALRTKINENLLVEAVGMAVITELSDASLFETDAIGVGTGPVDYYFSPSLNLTLKYERASNVILNTRDGKTDKF